MKIKLSVIVAGIALTCHTNLSAQAKQSIFDELQTPAAGKGAVIIDQPNELRETVGTQNSGNIEMSSDGKSFIRYQGFRVQIFSGNDHRYSKEEAIKREKEVKEVMPEITTYVNFDAPFWRVRVGDFGEREEAYDVQQKLMQLMPSYRKEMYIVREEIKLSVQ